MKPKNIYELDDFNRLVIKRNGKVFTTNGRLALDKDNQLAYWLNEPSSWRRDYDLPNKISFKGHWQLTRDYNFELIIDETSQQSKGNSLVVKGDIIAAEKDAIVFEINSLDRRGLSHIQILKFIGLWQTDEFNRIRFVFKKKTLPEVITFDGIWQINRNQQVTYSYVKTDLITKTKTNYTLTFEGFWQINTKDRLTYILSQSLDSSFDFCAQVGSANVYPQEGVIKYRLKIGSKGRKSSKIKIIYLHGTWKFSRKLGLVFQIDYGDGGVHNLEFSTEVSLNQKDKVIFSLRDQTGALIGLHITFTRRFLGKLDAEAYLRLKRTFQRETALEVGARIPF